MTGQTKAPAGADFVMEQQSQQRFTVDVFSYFNNALSLTAGFPAAFEPAVVLSRCEREEDDDYGRAGWLNEVFWNKRG